MITIDQHRNDYRTIRGGYVVPMDYNEYDEPVTREELLKALHELGGNKLVRKAGRILAMLAVTAVLLVIYYLGEQ